MTRKQAIEYLTNFLKNEKELDADKILTFVEKTLAMKRLRYISSGCMCGHFDKCNCGPGTYETGFDK